MLIIVMSRILNKDPNMTMFNSKGEVNASSVKEALEVLSKYASVVQNGLPSNFALAGQPALSDERRDELVARAISDQNGKLALAQAMANPINH